VFSSSIFGIWIDACGKRGLKFLGGGDAVRLLQVVVMVHAVNLNGDGQTTSASEGSPRGGEAAQI